MIVVMQKCPDCGGEMELSPIVIDTFPPIHEFFCEKCNAIWDWDGEKLHECFTSPRKKKEVKNEMVNLE